MAEPRSAMKEFRALDRKRAGEGLTPAEEARYAELRDLVEPDVGAGTLQGGFDVDAAAALLRESLLPAGTRDRASTAAAAEPELAVPAGAASGVEGELPDPPDATLAEGELSPPPEEAAADMDALLDSTFSDAPAAYAGQDASAGWAPGEPSWGDDEAGESAEAAQAWDPNVSPSEPAQPWDPDGPPHDPAQAWDPNAEYDPSAQPYDPNAQPYDPNALPYDPNALPYDPSALPYDPSALPYDPSAAPYDASQPYDPSAVPYDAGEPYDPDAAPYDSALPHDTDGALLDSAQHEAASAPPPEGAEPYELEPLGAESEASAWAGPEPFETSVSDAAETGATGGSAAWDPGSLVDGAEALDRGAEPWSGATDAVAGEAWETTSLLEVSEGGDALSAAEEAFAGTDAEGAPQASAPSLDEDAAPFPPPGWDAEPELPAPVPVEASALGEYDETGGVAVPTDDAELASLLPLEAADGAETGDFPEPLAPALGEYDDTAGFGRSLPVPPPDLREEGSGFHAAQIADGAPAPFLAESALDDPFQRDAGGSFDASADATVPEWASDGTAIPPWEESYPLGAAPHQLDELAMPEATAELAALEPVEPAPSPDAEDFTIDFDEGGASLHAGAASTASADADLGREPAGADSDLELPAEVGGGLSPEREPALAPEPPGADPVLDFSRPDFSGGDAGDHDRAPSSRSYLTPPSAPPFAPAAVPTLELEDALGAPEEIPTIEGEEILEEIPDAAADPLQPLDLGRAARAPEAQPEILYRLPGVHRVVVHTVEGQVRRGVLEEPDLAAATLALAPQPGGPPEDLASDRVKAIFFMLSPGEPAPAPEGKKVRVTFDDGRQVAGFSPDYDESGPGFFMVPGDTRTSTGRIWVYRAAARAIAVT
jgi:hypothetical protein